MTNREFFTAIANGTMNDETIAHATEALAKMDAANEKRKNKPSKTAIANEPIIENIMGVLTAEPSTASEVAVAVGISTQKASSLLRTLADKGVIARSETKMPKKGTVKTYALVAGESIAD